MALLTKSYDDESILGVSPDITIAKTTLANNTISLSDSIGWSSGAANYNYPIRTDAFSDSLGDVLDKMASHFGFSKNFCSTLFGKMCITEKQKEMLEMWDNSKTIEEFQVKCDAMFDGISTDDFIVISEHSLERIKDTKIYETTGLLSEQIFEIISKNSIFDEHIVKDEIFRHFSTELANNRDYEPSIVMKKMINVCLEKRQLLQIS